MSEKQELAENMEKTQARLQRAAKLTTGLADEQVRWADSVKVHYCKFGLLLLNNWFNRNLRMRSTTLLGMCSLLLLV